MGMFFRLKIFLEDYIIRYNLKVQSIGGKQGFKKFYWKYTTLRNWFGSGKGEAMYPIDIVRDVALGGAILKIFGFGNIGIIMVGVGILSTIVFIVIGHFKDFSMAWNIEQEWSSMRNPILNRIEKAVRSRGKKV